MMDTRRRTAAQEEYTMCTCTLETPAPRHGGGGRCRGERCTPPRCRSTGAGHSGSVRWTVILTVFMGLVARSARSQATSTPVVAATPLKGCFRTYEASKPTDKFTAPCAPITFNGPETNQCGNLSALQKTNPTQGCQRWFSCSGKIVFDCPCSLGTAFDVGKGICIDDFYANCTCPDGRKPTVEPTEPPVTAGNLGLIIGVVVGVLVIVILMAVIILLVRRRKQQKAKPFPPTMHQQDSIKSFGYEDITDLQRGEDPNIYDNPPVCKPAEYDNHGIVDREAIRPRAQNATIKSDTSSTLTVPPPLPGGHPSSTRSSIDDGIAQEEPEYMDPLE